MTTEITLRPLRGRAEYERCVELQRQTWGRDFVELVPAGLLKIIEQNGGLVAGAFDGERLVGFVIGLAAFRNGERVQWSHMLAVAPDARSRGIGRSLKLLQRNLSLERGVGTISWTFDPLQAANAHLNVNRLGAEVVEYVRDMYGSDTKSPLHPGDSTDRFVAEWRLGSERVRRAAAGERLDPPLEETLAAPLLGPEAVFETVPDAVGASRTEGGHAAATARELGAGEPAPDLPDRGAVRIEIPCDFLDLARRDPEEARRWRLATRRLFPHYLERGYVVRSFHRAKAEKLGDGGTPGGRRCFYYLERRSTA